MQSAVQSKQEVLNILRTSKETLRALGIARIGVFGSFSRDSVHADSDVDLLVEFAPGQTTFMNWSGVFDFAEEAFGRPVDVVTPDSLSKYSAPRILADTVYVSVVD